MKPPFDIEKFRSRIASSIPRDPRAPTAEQQPHVVRLHPVTSEAERVARWEQPQNWCRDHVDHLHGDRWSRRKDPITEKLEFSFSDPDTAVWFALRFR